MDCPNCKSGDVAMVEYSWDHPDHYDGVSEIYCQACGARYGRWSGRKLEDGESEGRYGQPSRKAGKRVQP